MKKSQIGFLFILPWVIGFIIFTVFPIIAALYIAMTDWSIIGQASFIGFQNFRAIFADPTFYKALLVTGRYAILAIPLTIITALLVALGVNNDYKGIGIFRTIFYMPSIVSGVAVAIVFMDFGSHLRGAQFLLRLFGLTGPDWFMIRPGFCLLSDYGDLGRQWRLYIYLAARADIPRIMREGATIDGAGWLQNRYITLLMLTPILL